MYNINKIFSITISLLAFLIFNYRLLWYLQVLQILEYFNKKYLTHLFRRAKEFIFDDVFLNILILFITLNTIFKLKFIFLNTIIIIFLILSLIYNINLYRKRKLFSKKGLKLTKRCLRIYFLNLSTVIIFIFLLFILNKIQLIPYLLFIIPFILLILNIFIYPLESFINNNYFKDAVKIIKEIKPFIIAITGSYGKTSTKYYIYQLLKDIKRVEMTPESYNTAMGITKYIRENLKKDTEIFIVEVAENEVGGFKRLLKLINPNILVITSVGIQHLEEFKDEKRIYDEFNYLVDYAISKDDIELIVLNSDDEFLNKFFNWKIKKGSINNNGDLNGQIIDESLNETKFKLYNSYDEILCETKIVGKESIRNIVLASLVGIHFGINFYELKEKIKNFEPFKHRLNVLNQGNIIVIDDAYNSNPIGAKMAIDLLSKYKDGRKIIITPGFVELGKKEFEENKNLGKYMKEKVDFVFLVGGKRTKPIYEGLIEVKFPKENIFIFKNFFEANEFLKTFLKPKDAILFENDLPEIYEEF